MLMPHPPTPVLPVVSPVMMRAILLTPAKQKPFKGNSIFWSLQDAFDDHNGTFTWSSHASLLIQLLAGLFSCLKPWVCALQVCTSSNNNPSGVWNCSPPRKQCDLGRWMPPGHVTDREISSTQASPLGLRDVAEGHVVFYLTLKCWICRHLMHLYSVSPHDFSPPKGLLIPWIHRFL